MKLRLLVPCFALALLNLTARAQDNPSQVNPSTSSQIGVGSTDVGLYVNPVGIHITNSQADTAPTLEAISTSIMLRDSTRALIFGTRLWPAIMHISTAFWWERGSLRSRL